MRIGLIALGSRGDVQPYVALGAGLHRAGHMVRIITHENYAGLVQAQGLEFWPVSGNVQDVAETEEMRALVEKGNFLWLFPRMTAVVHHGGAGATAAGLRAGVPSVVIPFFGDQPFWGGRVQELGVGPAPIPRSQLTADRLTQTIESATSDQAMRKRAAELGARIRREDGIGAAVAAIQNRR